jgi:hypothetical protein
VLWYDVRTTRYSPTGWLGSSISYAIKTSADTDRASSHMIFISLLRCYLCSLEENSCLEMYLVNCQSTRPPSESRSSCKISVQVFFHSSPSASHPCLVHSLNPRLRAGFLIKACPCDHVWRIWSWQVLLCYEKNTNSSALEGAAKRTGVIISAW